MSEVTLAASSVTVGSYVLKTEILNIDTELIGKLPSLYLMKLKDDNDDSISEGNTINAWLKRENDASWMYTFSGRIIEKRIPEIGQETNIEYEAIFLPEMNIRTISIAKYANSINLGTLCEYILDPLVTDGLLILDIDSNVYNNTIYYDGASGDYILNELTDVCKDNTIGFYFDAGNTIHIRMDADASNSNLNLDQTADNSEKIIDSQYVRSISRIRNTIDIFGNYAIIEKDGNPDYFTENTVGTGFTWSTWWSPDQTTWNSASGSPTQETSLTTGDYSVKHGIRRITGAELDVEILKCRLDLSSDPIYPKDSGLLKFDTHIIIERGNFIDWLFSSGYLAGLYLLNIKLFDTSGNSIWIDMKDTSHFEEEIGTGSSIAFFSSDFEEYQLRFVRKGWISNNSTFNWNISTIEISAYTRYKDVFDNMIGLRSGSFQVYIDNLHIDGIQARASYGDITSIMNYGERPYTEPIDTRGLDLDIACTIRAQNIINRLKDPEISLRSVEVIGNKDFQIGERIYVKTNEVDGTFTISGISQDFSNLDWHSNLILSSSEVYESTKSREVIDLKRDMMIYNLMNRVLALEGKANIISIGSGASPDKGSSIDPSSTINFNDVAFDWQSISSLSTEWKAEFIDWFPGSFFPADADGRSKFGTGFVNADLLLDGAVEDTKISLAKHLIRITWTNNDPGSTISWSQGTLSWLGTGYTISPGSTDNMYVWWDMDYGGGETLKVTNSQPALGSDDAIVCVNISGTAYPLLTDKLFPGRVIVTESITANEIAANAITTAKILAGAVNTSKLNVVSHYIDGVTFTVVGGIPQTISWTSGTIYYSGNNWSISGNTTNHVYIYWAYGDNSFSTSYQIKPSIDILTGDAMIAYNDWIGATIYTALNATAIYGGLIVTDSIKTDEIAANAITATELNLQSHELITTAFSAAGGSSIKWTTGYIKYLSTKSSIPAGTTGSRYVWWNNGESSFTTTDTFPSLGSGDALVAYNDSGEPFVAIQPTLVHGGFLKTFSIDADRIAAHVITADKLNIESHRITGCSFSNDTPTTNDVTWTAGTITYKGSDYAISGTNTSDRYLWWEFGESSFTTSDNNPSLDFDDVMIGINIEGTFITSFRSTKMHGGQIVTDSITAIQIAAGAITADQIDANAVTADKILANAITTSKLGLNAYSGSNPTVNGGEIWWRSDLDQLVFYDGATYNYIVDIPISANDLAVWSVAQITSMLTSWSTFYSAIGPSALTSVGLISTGAIDTVGQIVDGLITFPKVVADFWIDFFSLRQIPLEGSQQGFDTEIWTTSTGGSGGSNIWGLNGTYLGFPVRYFETQSGVGIGGWRRDRVNEEISLPFKCGFNIRTNDSSTVTINLGASNLSTNYIRLSWSPASSEWIAKTSDGALTQTTISGYDPQTSWRYLKILANSSSEVKFYIDGVSVATHSTNIPTGELYLEYLLGSNGTDISKSVYFATATYEKVE